MHVQYSNSLAGGAIADEGTTEESEEDVVSKEAEERDGEDVVRRRQVRRH